MTRIIPLISTAVKIRPATAGDLSDIQAIYAREVETSLATFEEDVPAIGEMERRYHSIVGAGKPYLVAEVDGAVAGYAYASVYRPRAAYRYTVENSVYIAEGFRNRGIGRRLLSTLIDECRLGPWHEMIAVIAETGQQGSVRLHAACGFRTIGRIENVGRKFDRWVATTLMQCALQADARDTGCVGCGACKDGASCPNYS